MKDAATRIIQILSPLEQKKVLLLAFFGVGAAVVQIAGIASIMPFLALLGNPGIVEENQYFAWAYQFFGFQSTNAFLFALGCLVFLAMLAGIGVTAATTWLQERFNAHTAARLSEDLLRRYLHRPYAYFLGRNSSELIKNIYGEVNQLVNTVIAPGIHLISHAVTALAVFILLLWVDAMLAILVGVIVGGAYVAVFYSVRRKLTQLGERRLRANRERFKAGAEAFAGIKDIKLMGGENLYAAGFSQPAREIARCSIAQRLIGHMPRYAMEAVAFGGMLIIILYLLTVKRDVTTALPLIGLYAVAGYKMMPVLQQIFFDLTSLRAGGPVLENIHRELHASYPDEEEVGPCKNLNRDGQIRVRKCIELLEVTFAYPGCEQPVLKEFSLSIPAGATVGLVGATGSGKTTAIDLVLGLLRPGEGELAVDGKPIDGSNLRRWQNSVGYVSQTIHLADKSLAANIAFGVPEAEIDLDRVRECAQAACIADWVEKELPNGYRTRVGERGVRLSGGQRQRIGIARAFYHAPDVLVLDEATSALDTVTEQQVMHNIRAVGQPRTIIIVAHRLTTVKQCDHIFMLDTGKVSASGNYEELLNANERFQALASANR